MKYCLLTLMLSTSIMACQPAEPTPANTAPEPVLREVIATPDAPEAIGPYSQAIKMGNTIYCAGQIGLDPSTRQMVEGGIEAETHRVMQNLQAVLSAGGFDMGDIVQAQVFLADLNDYGTMNAIYATYFEGHTPPARAAVQVARLPLDARVEIMMTAVK